MEDRVVLVSTSPKQRKLINSPLIYDVMLSGLCHFGMDFLLPGTHDQMEDGKAQLNVISESRVATIYPWLVLPLDDVPRWLLVA